MYKRQILVKILVLVILTVISASLEEKNSPEQRIKSYIMRAENEYNPKVVPWDYANPSPLLVRLRVEVKGILNINLIEGTIKVLCAFRAYYKDPKLSWDIYVNKDTGKTTNCTYVALQREQLKKGKGLIRYVAQPDEKVCIDKISSSTGTDDDRDF